MLIDFGGSHIRNDTNDFRSGIRQNSRPRALDQRKSGDSHNNKQRYTALWSAEGPPSPMPGTVESERRKTLRMRHFKTTRLTRSDAVRSATRFLIMLAMSWVGSIDRVLAEDRIRIQPQQPTPSESDWYPGIVQAVVAQIKQFDDRQLRFVESGSDAETTISADRVIWIEPEQRSDVESVAVGLFKTGEYAQSLQKLPEILQQRPPIWHQQWLTMMASVAAARCGRCNVSLELVSQLDRRPLPPLVLAWLPIQWQNGKPTADAEAQAIRRLDDSSPLVQLVTASWLLSTKHRSQSIAVLNVLKESERTEIRSLAEVLSWRTATPPEVIQSARRWQQHVDALPMVWQSGPTQTLIDKFQSAGLSDQADRLKWSLELTPIHPTP